ncbi:MAG: heavy metal translocating P-type ATPase [Candidatus Heimdallarchaeota archaeon]
MNSFVVTVEGIDCAGCAKSFANSLVSQGGIVDARYNIAFKKLYVDYNSEEITEEEIIDYIKFSGYSIVMEDESADSEKSKRKSFWASLFSKKELYTTLVSILVFGVGLLLEYVFDVKWWIPYIVFIVATLVGGVFIFKKALFSLRRLSLDINILMSVAAIAALIIGEAMEATSIVVLFSIAELAEALSVEQAKSSIERLIDYAPSDAIVLKNKKEIVLPAKSVEINSITRIKPGERIPLDGVIVDGQSYINEAPITGESMPIMKKPGDEVFAGTLVEDGSLEVKVTKPYEEMFLKKIVALVESSDSRAPIENFVDVFAKYYTPTMFLVAILTAIIPPLAFGYPFIDWIYNGLIILVISCPCAVVLSTPITIIVALNRAAKNGVLIKGGIYIETISKAKAFAFDKTGTLTVGQPQVDDIIPHGSMTENELLKICGSLEAKSNHPIAKALHLKLAEEELDLYNVEDFNSIAGKGIEGKIDGNLWIVGNPRLLIEREITMSDELATSLSHLQYERKTVIAIADHEDVVGLISISDKLKPHAKGIICELKALNIEKTIMLTGDNSKTAAIIAEELGVDEYRAELLPNQKMDMIDELREEFGEIVMIGDGINDAPALAAADVGIAMGVSGSDIALETADIALMTDRLDSMHYLVTLSRKSMNIIIQNIILAILIKVVLFVLSYMGFVSLWMAVLIGDMGVSLLVIFNAILRAKGKKMTHLFCDATLCSFDNQILEIDACVHSKDKSKCFVCSSV